MWHHNRSPRIIFCKNSNQPDDIDSNPAWANRCRYKHIAYYRYFWFSMGDCAYGRTEYYACTLRMGERFRVTHPESNSTRKKLNFVLFFFLSLVLSPVKVKKPWTFGNSRRFAKVDPHDILFVYDRWPGGFSSLIIDVLPSWPTTVRIYSYWILLSA